MWREKSWSILVFPIACIGHFSVSLRAGKLLKAAGCSARPISPPAAAAILGSEHMAANCKGTYFAAYFGVSEHWRPSWHLLSEAQPPLKTRTQKGPVRRWPKWPTIHSAWPPLESSKGPVGNPQFRLNPVGPSLKHALVGSTEIVNVPVKGQVHCLAYWAVEAVASTYQANWYQQGFVRGSP